MFNLSTISNPNFIMNAVMHSFILFSFLSIFFYLFISQLTTGAFEDEVNGLVNDMITKTVATDIKQGFINFFQNFIANNPNAKYLLLLLGINIDNLNNMSVPQQVKDTLQSLANLTNKPDPTTTLINNSLFSKIFIINIMIWVFYVILCIMFSIYDSDFHILEIIIENLIIFIWAESIFLKL